MTQAQKVRRCRACQTPNPLNAPLCQKCHQPLDNAPIEELPLTSESRVGSPKGGAAAASSETRTPEHSSATQREAGPPLPRLILVHEAFQIEVTPQAVIGREAVGRQHLRRWDTVSRRHAQFFYEGGKWYLQDMRSTNGTYHNDRLLRSERVELKAGDRIGLGASLTLRVEILKGD
jgi:hypothetical protein